MRESKEPRLSDLRECVTGDTLVVLRDGRRVPIRTLVGEQPEVVATTPTGRLTTAQSDLVWAVGSKPVFEVRLASGRSIRATAEHRLFGASGWQRVKDVAVGDRLAIARRLPEPENPDIWPDDHVVLLGQLIGDGSYLNNAPMRYTTASEENSRAVTDAAVHGFGCRVIRYAGRRAWHQLMIAGNGNRWHPAGVNAWLRALGIFGQRSHQKRIPEAAFRLSNRQIALLLRHLWATDGTINLPSEGAAGIHYATNSSGLATDVAALLLRLGIVARITVGRKLGYRPSLMVGISGAAEQLAFLERVGAFGPRVGPAQRLRSQLSGIRPNTNVDTLPATIWDRVRAIMRMRSVSTRQMAAIRGTSYGGTGHFGFAPSRRVVEEYAEILASRELMAHATSDLFWDRVVSVKPAGLEEVFDLTVPGPSNWLADGIVSHNSGSLEQDSDLVVMLWRDKEKPGEDQDDSEGEIVNLKLAKHRNGPTGEIQLWFKKRQTRFVSYAGERYAEAG
jgi:replicative DNA helicase